MSKTWVLDGGRKRAILVIVLAVVLFASITVSVGGVYLVKLSHFADNSAAVNDFGAVGAPASATAGDADDVDRPDPLSAARDGASRWLGGDPSSLSPDALATAPTAPQGASLPDGGEVLVDGDGYSVVSLPILANNATGTLTVEMSWDGTRWQIISLLVG